jgi:EmrB/QacA subfamily drug resistance transporter
MTEHHRQAITGAARTAALLAVLLATFMDLMDVTILFVVLPTITTDLGASPAAAEWASVGYTLALALTLITGARVGDRVGYKNAFLGGMAGFILASALCGLAVSPEMLVAARVFQGLFAAVMVPQVLSLIQVMYAPAERGPAMAAYSTLTPLASAVGVVLGPVLMEWDIAGAGWRLVFLVNVVVGAVVLPLAWRLLPTGQGASSGRFDFAGVGLSALGTLLILYPLVTSADRGTWPWWATATAVGGLLVLAIFVRYQISVAKRGGEPLIRISLFRTRSLTGGLVVQLLYLSATIGFFLVFLQFLQRGLAFSPLSSGLMLVPWSIVVALLAGASATVLLPRIGRYTIFLGLFVNAVGFIWLAVVAQNATLDTGWVQLLPGVLIGAVGMGLVTAPVAVLTLSELAPEDAGAGSGLFNTFSQLGSSVGVALIGTLFFITAGRGPSNTDASATSLFGDALGASLWAAVGLLAVAFVAAWLLPRPNRTPDA